VYILRRDSETVASSLVEEVPAESEPGSDYPAGHVATGKRVTKISAAHRPVAAEDAFDEDVAPATQVRNSYYGISLVFGGFFAER
jgi:hypothetical protein